MKTSQTQLNECKDKKSSLRPEITREPIKMRRYTISSILLQATNMLRQHSSQSDGCRV